MGTERRRSSGRRTNLALLVVVPLAGITGLFANTIGTSWPIAPAVVHGIVAFAVILLMPWKSIVIRRGVARRRVSMVISIALLLVLGVKLTALLYLAPVLLAVALSVLRLVTAGAAGALVSTTMLSAAESAPTLPAASVACAVTA